MNDTIFKVGDKVWSFSLQEWGKVIAISNDTNISFRIEVAFKNGDFNTTYTIDGKLHIVDKASDLYFEELQAPKLARPLQDKDIVMCWNDKDFGMEYRFYDAVHKGIYSIEGKRQVISWNYYNMEYIPDNEAPARLVAMRSQLQD